MKIEPKTEFLRKIIKKTKWKDRQYVHDLLNLEKYILGELNCGWTTGYLINRLLDEYPDEHIVMLKELKLYRKYLNQKQEEKRKEREDELAYKRWEKKKTDAERKAWLEAGGKP